MKYLQVLLAIAFLSLIARRVAASQWSNEDHEIFDIVSSLEAAEGKDVNFYSFLNITKGATASELSRAFKKRSLELHPDKNKGVKGAAERFARLGTIAAILKDAEKRTRYDFFYENGVPRWRGTGYYYSRYRPGLGAVFFVIVLFTCMVQLVFFKLQRYLDLQRIYAIQNDAKLLAYGKQEPGEGRKKVKVPIGRGAAYDPDEDGPRPPPSANTPKIEVVIDNGRYFIVNDDGSESPLDDSAVPRKGFGSTWLPSLLSTAVAKVLGSKKKELEDKEESDEDDGTGTGTESDTAGPSRGGKRSKDPVAKIGGRRRKVNTKKR